MFKILQTINIGKENPVLTYEQPFERGDKNAHTWEVRVYDKNNMPVDLTGMNVIAYFSPRELEKSFSVHGTIESNVAKVTLDEKCYAVSGRLTGVLQVSNVDDIVTMAIAQFRVREDINEQIVETGDPINNVQDLLAQIEAMKSATKAATDAAYQANLGTEAANAAAEAANSAAGTAGLAANAANNSASLANSAASNADEAAKRANTAAETIETATGAADEAAEAANQAAERANTAAAVVDENLEKVELNISEAGNVQIAAIQAAGAAQTQAVNSAGAAQQAAIENKAANALASIPEDYTTLDADVKSLKDHKADAIRDTSAKAASHTLHAQDGSMNVTLFGKTTETGSGDKSPENPYTISGVSEAQIAAASANLMDPSVSPKNQYINTGIAVGDTVKGLGSTGSKLYPKVMRVTAGKRYYLITRNPNPYAISARQSVVADENDTVLEAGTSMRLWTYKSLVKAFTPNATGYLWLAVDRYTENVAVVEAANVITPPLLPDGAPLYGNGTVDDTVENDVPSGCDKCIMLDGSDDEGWYEVNTNGVFKYIIADWDIRYSSAFKTDRLTVKVVSMSSEAVKDVFNVFLNQQIEPDLRSVYLRPTGIDNIDDFKAYLQANPLTVFYRSTDYTPDKDLRVCRVTRRTRCATLDGSKVETASWPTYEGHVAFKYPKPSDWVSYGTYNNQSGYWVGELWSRHNPVTIGQIFTNGETTKFSFLLSEGATLEEAQAIVDGKKFVYQLKTPEIYMTDCHELRKPVNLIPVTVTGSGETAVEYPHDTKHYIDQKFDALAAALLS